jgi:hypothetical protein
MFTSDPICPICRKPFQRHTSQQIICKAVSCHRTDTKQKREALKLANPEAFRADLDSKSAREKARRMQTKTCEQCGNDFETSDSRRKTCSIKCNDKRVKARRVGFNGRRASSTPLPAVDDEEIEVAPLSSSPRRAAVAETFGRFEAMRDPFEQPPVKPVVFLSPIRYGR